MKKINTSILSMLGAFLIIFFCLLGCTKDDWQDHLTDPGLGGELPAQWIGKWTMVEWFEQDDTGAIVGSEEHEGYVIYNEDGTCEFKCFEDELSGTYVVDQTAGTVTHDLGDEWWDGPWQLTIQGNEMTWFTGDPDGAGEGYVFEK